MRKRQRGFAILEVIIIVIVLVAIAVSGYIIYHRHTKKDDTSTDSSRTSRSKDLKSSQKDGAATTSTLDLAGGKVSMVLPKSWTSVKGDNYCLGNATANVSCVEGARITPGVKLPTIYGDGSEFFYISVSVFDNPKQSSAKEWFENDFQAGVGSGKVQTSSAPINGYDTFYMQQQYSAGEGVPIREMDYTFSVNGKTVLVHARTYEPGRLSDGRAAGDFRQFEPQIAEMAESIKIDY